MISFASDVDQQTPWHGAAIHRVINEEIGLPISDSLWPQGASMDASSLFLGGVTLNTRPSNAGTQSTAGLLVRQWHRGNIDAFHSWSDDGTPPLVQRIGPSLPLASMSTVIDVEPAPKALASLFYRHLRLYFDAPPPPDMYWKLFDDAGKSIIVGIAQIKAGSAVRPVLSTPPFVVEVITGVPQDIGLTATREAFDLFRLARIEIVAPSCSKGCPAKIYRIDRDNFSRRAAALQLPWLEAFNVRPVMLTAHGGWSFAQNLGSAAFSLTMKRERGSAYESNLVPNVLRLLGNDPTEYAYHSDLLRRLGTNSVWQYGKESRHEWNQRVPPLSPGIPGFYNLVRTGLGTFRTDSLENFRKDILALEPRLKNFDLDDIYCFHTCWGDQGAIAGLLIALSLTQTQSVRHVDQLWYVHLATGDDEFKRTANAPLRPSVVTWMRRLANRYYNFDGNTQLAQRVWVPAGGLVARYRIAQAQIAPHVKVDRDTSRVTIAPWKDPVTGVVLPDAVAGTRDFHGITIYVPNSEKATLTIGKGSTGSFTRNPRDETGRQSITIVDDSTPEVMLDELPLAENGKVDTNGGKWHEPGNHRSDAASGDTFGTLTATGGDAIVRWKPARLDLWNATHVSFAYRKGAANGVPRGKLMLEIEMEDGGITAISEDGSGSDSANRSRWIVPSTNATRTWNRIVLAISDLQWPKTGLQPGQQRPPLPIGRVREIRFGLLGAGAEERLDIDALATLRPNSNGVDPANRKLVGGQVIDEDGKPAPSIVVQANLPKTGKTISTVTDNNGYYYFFRQPVRQIMEITASRNGKRCVPARGKLLEVRKDEAEIDIELRHCG